VREAADLALALTVGLDSEWTAAARADALLQAALVKGEVIPNDLRKIYISQLSVL
jgi:hypothetical protein